MVCPVVRSWSIGSPAHGEPVEPGTLGERPYLDLSPVAPHCGALGFFLPRILVAIVRRQTRAEGKRNRADNQMKVEDKGQKACGFGKWKRLLLSITYFINSSMGFRSPGFQASG